MRAFMRFLIGAVGFSAASVVMAQASLSSTGGEAEMVRPAPLPIASTRTEWDRVGPTAEQKRAFQEALPARLALVQKVATKFGPLFLEDSARGQDRFRLFMLQAHQTPSDTLEDLLTGSHTLQQFAEGLQKAKTSPGRKALGDNLNLTFYPYSPCRIADSRLSSAGKLVSGVARQYENYATSPQGAADPCNNAPPPYVLEGSTGAVALTVTVTEPEGPGYLTLRPVGATALTSVINFVQDQTVANSTVVQMTGAGLSTPDFEIVPAVFGGGGKVHVVLDLLGFYLASEPTPLQCNWKAASSSAQTTSGFKSLQVPACDAGFTFTGAGCSQNGSDGTVLMSVLYQELTCEWRQSTTSAITYTSRSRCCRVPGQTGARVQ